MRETQWVRVSSSPLPRVSRGLASLKVDSVCALSSFPQRSLESLAAWGHAQVLPTSTLLTVLRSGPASPPPSVCLGCWWEPEIRRRPLGWKDFLVPPLFFFSFVLLLLFLLRGISGSLSLLALGESYNSRTEVAGGNGLCVLCQRKFDFQCPESG